MQTPLAARMRPRDLDEVVGQPQLIETGSALRRALATGTPPSTLLWGPPGTGKTTIARLIAAATGFQMRQISAVTSGLPELRKIIAEVQAEQRGMFARRMLLFVDEIHRWNKAQQDALLPYVEEGTVTLVGATTENPAFQVIPALRSRCWLLQLQALDEAAILTILERALNDERGLPDITATPEALDLITQIASGDARRALSILERAASDSDRVTHEAVAALAERPDLGHTPQADAHFDVSSAFIKSMRGSDPDAAIYWLARLLEAGEDPVFIARRMVIFASEDVGNADPRSLPLAVSAMQAAKLIGPPEVRIILAQACTWLASAPKSNASYQAINRAQALVRQTGPLPVPLHLRNAPTQLAKSLGHGVGYQYPHDHPHHIVAQQYTPDALPEPHLYEPTAHGAEKTITERLAWWKRHLQD